MNAAVYDLGESRTHRERVAEWVAVPGGWHLTLTLVPRRGRKVERDEYAVEGQDAGGGSREYLLVNLTDGDTDVYGVTVYGGRVTGCTCTGFRATGGCKHTAAVAALLGGML